MPLPSLEQCCAWEINLDVQLPVLIITGGYIYPLKHNGPDPHLVQINISTETYADLHQLIIWANIASVSLDNDVCWEGGRDVGLFSEQVKLSL